MIAEETAGVKMAATHYRPITLSTISKSPYWQHIPRDVHEAIKVVGEVLPFRVNEYVLSELIDWSEVPDDPIFRLLFPQREMLLPEQFEAVSSLVNRRAGPKEIAPVVNSIRASLNPHPDGQLTHNIPVLDDHLLPGLQHKYRETVLFFPAEGQVCHAYCTFCFRWPQFVGLPELKFQARETADLRAYLQRNPDVTDVLFTGGDPMIMKASTLARQVESLLTDELKHVQTIRIGTKAITYWPYRFVTDNDADDVLRLFEKVVASGRHLALIAHINHPRELSPQIARRAIERIRSTGAVIRVQSPVIRHINETVDVWVDLLNQSVQLGMVPYYMFVERDTGPHSYFEVPLVRALEIFDGSFRQVSGLARTLRGPTMSAFAGKVIVDGIAESSQGKCFVLHYLQARDPGWVKQPFFARYDVSASWFSQLHPVDSRDRKFFPHLPAHAGAQPAI